MTLCLFLHDRRFPSSGEKRSKGIIPADHELGFVCGSPGVWIEPLMPVKKMLADKCRKKIHSHP